MERLESKETSKRFLNRLAKKLDFKTMDDWYTLKVKDLGLKGPLIIASYQSIPNMLKFVFPEHKWLDWKFISVSRVYWNKHDNARNFLDWLAHQLGFRKMDDWYKITFKDIQEKGGTGLLYKYGGSPSKVLQSVYSEYPWKTWRFQNVPRGTWSQLDGLQRVELIQWLAKEMKVTHLDDWYRISSKMIAEKLSPEVFNLYPLESLLQEAYPNHKWNVEMIKDKSQSMRASQRMLVKTVEELFPNSGDQILFSLSLTDDL